MTPVAGSANTAGLSTMRARDGSRDRNLDDVDAKERGARVAGDVADAARELLFLAHAGRARVVDDDPAVVARDDRVRVRAAARLHLADLPRLRRIGDVEDADAAEALGARVDAATPSSPQSTRPRVCSTDMIKRSPTIETSPCPPGQTTDDKSCGACRLAGGRR